MLSNQATETAWYPRPYFQTSRQSRPRQNGARMTVKTIIATILDIVRLALVDEPEPVFCQGRKVLDNGSLR